MSRVHVLFLVKAVFLLFLFASFPVKSQEYEYFDPPKTQWCDINGFICQDKFEDAAYLLIVQRQSSYSCNKVGVYPGGCPEYGQYEVVSITGDSAKLSYKVHTTERFENLYKRSYCPGNSTSGWVSANNQQCYAPKCAEGEERNELGVCVQNCTGGQVPNSEGVCECPPGKVMLNGQCTAEGCVQSKGQSYFKTHPGGFAVGQQAMQGCFMSCNVSCQAYYVFDNYDPDVGGLLTDFLCTFTGFDKCVGTWYALNGEGGGDCVPGAPGSNCGPDNPGGDGEPGGGDNPGGGGNTGGGSNIPGGGGSTGGGSDIPGGGSTGGGSDIPGGGSTGGSGNPGGGGGSTGGGGNPGGGNGNGTGGNGTGGNGTGGNGNGEGEGEGDCPQWLHWVCGDTALPDLEVPPASQFEGAYFKDVFSSLLSWSPSVGAGSCSPINLSLLDKQYQLSVHCTLINEYFHIFSTVMGAIWSLIAFRVVMSA